MTNPSALEPAQAHARLREFHVVDVRRAHEYHGPLGRVPGAILLPLPELEARAEELPRGRALLLVCRSGVRSGKACDALAARGFGPVVNLTGGMIGWNQAGLPTETTPPRSLAELLDGLIAWAAQVGARPQPDVRDALRSALASEAHDLDAPTPAAVARAIELVERELCERGAPPDLELSVGAYRRWLAAL